MTLIQTLFRIEISAGYLLTPPLNIQRILMPEKRFRAIVSGKVQGVCFRASAEDEACLLGLRGRVRNMSDGSVEVIAEGEEEKLARLLKWLHHGPAGAAVREVKTIREEPTGEYDDFKIAY